MRGEWEFLGSTPGNVWPALPGNTALAVLALLTQLDRTETMAIERLQERQARQLALLAAHAWRTVAYYREAWQGHYDPTAPMSLERLRSLPILKRSHLQQKYQSFKTRAFPEEHGEAVESRTSGSTGVPVRIMATGATRLFWDAIALRDHAWHRRDLSGRLAVIRRGVTPGTASSWGKATDGLVRTGEAAMRGVDADIMTQLDWLERQAPAYLLTYPSLAAALAEESLRRGRRLPGLLQVRTLGEALGTDLRMLCREAWGVPLADVYSAEEVGYIALQCPEHEHYHVQAESVLLEVLDERDKPCGPGEVGRVVVTDLHNYATPLIRYELGDYAESGAGCSCGRTLPVLKRILGRVRNMLATADGKRYWPSLGVRRMQEVAPVTQCQFVQRSLDLVEARLVVARGLTPGEEDAIRDRLLAKLPAGFRVAFTYHAEIPRGVGGKFEEFLSEVSAGR